MISSRRTKLVLVVAGSVILLILAPGLWLSVKATLRDERYRRAADAVGGDAVKGLAAIDRYGCAACHIIPGAVPGTTPTAPPLTGVGERSVIAGIVENKPENLIRWIVNPLAMDPHTAMPNVGVTPADARDIATYLYSTK